MKNGNFQGLAHITYSKNVVIILVKTDSLYVFLFVMFLIFINLEELGDCV